MFELKDKSLLRFVPDYKINLITPEGLSEEDLQNFHTEFRKVMKFIKYSADKDALKKMLDDDESFESVSRDTAKVISAVTNSKFNIPENEEEIDMCKAIKDWVEEEREAGREEEKRTNALNFYHLGISLDKIAQGVNVSIDTIQKWITESETEAAAV